MPIVSNNCPNGWWVKFHVSSTNEQHCDLRHSLRMARNPSFTQSFIVLIRSNWVCVCVCDVCLLIHLMAANSISHNTGIHNVFSSF